jgi:hypothetical protein
VGSVWVSDETGYFEFSNANQCSSSPGGERCQGSHLHFRLLVRGPYNIKMQGSELTLTAVGRGSALIEARRGTYSLDGAPRRQLPRGSFRRSF